MADAVRADVDGPAGALGVAFEVELPLALAPALALWWLALCSLWHGSEHVGAWHEGHLYFDEEEEQTMHGPSGAGIATRFAAIRLGGKARTKGRANRR